MSKGKPAKRKGIGKTKRFEVFKRDNFTCCYCGRKPPDVMLELDHVKPVAEGGGNGVANLLTACFECNSGKGRVPLEDRIPESFTDSELERCQDILERRAAAAKINALNEKIQDAENAEINDCVATWNLWSNAGTGGKLPLPQNHRASFRGFSARLGVADVKASITIAMERGLDPSMVWKYFCGVCWTKIRAQEVPGG